MKNFLKKLIYTVIAILITAAIFYTIYSVYLAIGFVPLVVLILFGLNSIVDTDNNKEEVMMFRNRLNALEKDYDALKYKLLRKGYYE